MIPMFDDPIGPGTLSGQSADTEHVARCEYLAAVQAAQRNCDALIRSAQAEFLLDECAAWETYQAASDQAVRVWESPSAHAVDRWGPPAPGSHPYPPKG